MIAAIHPRMPSGPGEPALRRQRLRAIFRRIQELPLPPSAKILELGSGAGGVAVMLAERGYSVEAVDPAPHAGVWDARHLPFADGTFDLVIAIGALPPDLKTAEKPVREWARVLKPGGFTVANADQRSSQSFRSRISSFLERKLFRGAAEGPKPKSIFDSAAGLEKIPAAAEIPDLIIARKSALRKSKLWISILLA